MIYNIDNEGEKGKEYEECTESGSDNRYGLLSTI